MEKPFKNRIRDLKSLLQGNITMEKFLPKKSYIVFKSNDTYEVNGKLLTETEFVEWKKTHDVELLWHEARSY